MIGDGQDVELIIHNNAVGVLAEREQESFIEPGLDL